MQNKNLSNRSNSLTPQDLEAIAMPKDAQIAEARERAFERLYQLRVANQIEREQERELRRRDVFRTAALSVVALAGVGATARTMLKETSRGQATSMSSKDMLAPTITGVELAGRFAWENVLFQAGQWAFAALCHDHRLPIGNASISSGALRRADIELTVRAFEKDSECATRLYLTMGIAVPLAEEMMFRVLPSLLTPSPGVRWDVGIPFNLIYSLTHSVVQNEVPTNISIPLLPSHKLNLDKLPISQFFLGAFCWYCARTYGSLAPILTHGLNNQIPAIVVAWGGKETFDTFSRFLDEELEHSASATID